MKITVRKTVVRGEKKWVVSRFVDGKRKRSFFDSQKAANDESESLRAQIRTSGEQWVNLEPKEKTEIMMVLSEVKESGYSIRKVWDSFRNGLGNTVAETRTLSQAIQELLISKRASKRRGRYIDSLEEYLGQFSVGREGVLVSRITPCDIENWFNGRSEAESTKMSNLGRLSALFSYCYRKSYIAFNPCDKIERPRIPENKPVTLSRFDCLRLLAKARKTDPSFVAYLVLGMLAGLRPSEASRLTWSKIDFKKRRIQIDADITKVDNWRYVPLERGAVKWLRWCRLCVKGPLIPKQIRRRRSRLCKRTRIKLTQDTLRKTAASFLMAKHGQDSQKVADILGNSPRILKKNYRALRSPEEAAVFWGEPLASLNHS